MYFKNQRENVYYNYFYIASSFPLKRKQFSDNHKWHYCGKLANQQER